MYLVHIPHSSTYIPPKFLSDYYLDKEELEANIIEYADLYTDELFDNFYRCFGGVKSPYSRLLFDPERFEDDEKEPMHTKYGLGWFYEMAILEKKPLRKLDSKESLRKLYRLHHQKLSSLVKDFLKCYSQVTIIDAHSFSNRSYWFFKKDDFPDICIGFDDFHKDTKLIEIIEKAFRGYEIAYNFPYEGSLVPLEFYQKQKRVKSVMIEINKRVYLNKDNKSKSKNFDEIKKILDKIFFTLRKMDENPSYK